VDAVNSVCCTQRMMYLMYAVLIVCYTKCQLMIMTGRNKEGPLKFGLCDDSRVVDKKERDGGRRLERSGGYKQR
jgi:hypothetical protein